MLLRKTTTARQTSMQHSLLLSRRKQTSRTIGSFNGWAEPGVALTAGEGNVYTVEFDEEDGFTAETAYGNFALKGADWHHKIQPDTLFTTLEGDTLVTITLAEGAAAYFNTATEAWDGLSEELYSVQVSALAA